MKSRRKILNLVSPTTLCRVRAEQFFGHILEEIARIGIGWELDIAPQNVLGEGREGGGEDGG
jgi:hypothetical protein